MDKHLKGEIEGMTDILSRNVPLNLPYSALLIIDVQHFCCHPDGGEFKGLGPDKMDDYQYFFHQLEQVTISNIRSLQEACRTAGIEVLFTVVESLTLDGRDRGLDYKISGFHVPKGSPDAQVLPAIKPHEDEMVFPKSSSSVFISTNIDYVLRNLNCRHLVICGVLTDQCVESAVRDACDLNYLVTLVTDACTTYSEARHRNSLAAIEGYCRQVTTAALIDEIRAKACEFERD